MNDKVETNSDRKTKKISKRSDFSEKGVSCNWINFLKSDGKNVRKSLKLDPNEKMEAETTQKEKAKRMTKPGETNKTNIKSSKKKDDPLVTKVMAIDCEMVSDINDKNMLGRVSIVNFKLQCIYDRFVKPTIPVGDYRTRVSGIREIDLENGTDFDVVQKEVRDLIRNKIIVGHALRHDFKVLRIYHNDKLWRDTSKYEKFLEAGEGKTPSLKKLAKLFLGENIQEGEHSSVEDAKTAMKLYIKYRHEWERIFLNTNNKNMILNVKGIK